MDPGIVAALVEMAIFLEFTSDDLLDADAAVEAMEQMGASLQSASDDTKRALADAISSTAQNYGHAAEFVRELPESLGLI